MEQAQPPANYVAPTPAQIDTFKAGTAFLNVYNTSQDRPSANQKYYFKHVRKVTTCCFCPNPFVGLNHVVQADLNTVAQNRPVRLAPGCAACNNTNNQLTLRGDRVLWNTASTASRMPFFVLDQ